MKKTIDTARRCGATFRAGLGLLTRNERRQALACGLAIVVVEAILLASIALMLPLVSVIVEPATLENHGGIAWVHGLLGGPSADWFVITVALSALAGLIAGHLGIVAVNAWTERFIARAATRLSRDLVEACGSAPWPWFLQRNASALARTVHEDPLHWARGVVGPALRLLSHGLALGSTTALVLAVTPIGGLVLLVLCGLLAGFTMRMVRASVIRWSRAEREASGEAMVATHQMFAGIKDIHVACAQPRFLERMHAATARRMRSQARAQSYRRVPPVATVVVAKASLVVVLLTLWRTEDGAGELAALMALVVMATARILPAMNRLQEVTGGVYAVLPRIEGIIELAASARRARDEETRRVGAGAVPEGWRALGFDRVSFTYPGSSRPALREVTFSMPRGAMVGLVGPSGAGKSTCVDLLVGLLRPSGGAVLVGGVSLAGIDRSQWCARIGYVPQEPFFLDDTLAANIAFGLDFCPARAAVALRRSGLTAFVAGLPAGLDTPLGEQGVRVSGGQRQRIAIARALYRRPEVLVLDEATSALDSDSEQVVVQTLARIKGEVSVLVVSHRRSALAACDRVVELAAGRVVKDRPAVPADSIAGHG